MPNPNGAGDLPLEQDLTGVLTIRKGDIQGNPRRGDKIPVTVKVSDGFAVLKARIDTIARPKGVPEGFVIYFRKTKTATQAQFGELTAENFEGWLRIRWAKITQEDVTKWQEQDGKEPKDVEVFEFYVYKQDRPEPRANRIYRATQPRIAEARRRLEEHNNQIGREMGAIEMGHVAVVNARHPEGHELVLPEDNTTRQAHQLDRLREEVQNENKAAVAARNATYKPITIQLNGTDVEVLVNVQSLRDALGLPPYNMFHEGLYRDYVHQEVAPEEDQYDDEHKKCTSWCSGS